MVNIAVLTRARLPRSPAAATQLTITTQPSASASSGVAFAQQPAIQLRDAGGVAVAQAGVIVTAAIATGGGSLGGTTTATTDPSGVATFTNLSITGTTGNRTLMFSAPGTSSINSNTIALAGAPASQLVITTQPSATATSGSPFAQQPVVRLQDASGNNVSQSGVVITASIASGSGTLSGTLTATTNASGIATFSNLTLTGSAGGFTLGFAATGLTGATSTSIALSAGSSTPNLAYTDFDSGSLGAAWFTDGNGGTTTTIINDPTGSGRGKVAQIRYQGSGSIIDENRAVYFGDPNTLPTHFFWAFDIYFPTGIFNYTNSAIERKLVYFRDSTNYRDFVLFIWGNQLGYVIETPPDFSSKQRLGIATFPAGQWHRLEGELQFNSSPSSSNGLCRVWLNGTLVSEQLNIQLYTAGVPLYNEFMGFGYQREGGTSKDPSDTSCDEVRYLDRIGLSTTRIGA